MDDDLRAFLVWLSDVMRYAICHEATGYTGGTEWWENDEEPDELIAAFRRWQAEQTEAG